MTWFLMALTLAANLLLPLYLIGLLAFTRSGDRLARIALALLTGAYLVLVWRLGPWAWVGGIWPYVFAGLYALALIRAASGVRALPWLPARRLRARLVTGFTVALATVLLARLPAVFLGARLPAEPLPLSLSFPLDDGNYRIVQGGSNRLLNHHYPIAAQRYALDIVAVDDLGLRARGLLPADPSAYALFGWPVLAPCSGRVLDTRDGLVDQRPPLGEREHPAGNYVTLACHGHTVLLAHLRNGSVRVRSGRQVDAGTVLGEAGNSGNTSEPHLHIHAVKGLVGDHEALIGDATAVPLLLDGKFLVRNDLVRK
jgi:hypothetical protein